jgi:hypothetical protein
VNDGAETAGIVGIGIDEIGVMDIYASPNPFMNYKVTSTTWADVMTICGGWAIASTGVGDW